MASKKTSGDHIIDEIIRKYNEDHINDTILDDIYYDELLEYYYIKYLNDQMVSDMWKKQNENITMQDVLLQSWKDFLESCLNNILFNMDCNNDDYIAIIELKYPAPFKKTKQNIIKWLLAIFKHYDINIIDHYSAAIEYTARCIVKEYAITKYINESKTFDHVDNLYCEYAAIIQNAWRNASSNPEYAICRKIKNK